MVFFNECCARINIAAFQDCPGMPRASPHSPCNHSLNCHWFKLLTWASFSSASAARAFSPRAAQASQVGARAMLSRRRCAWRCCGACLLTKSTAINHYTLVSIQPRYQKIEGIRSGTYAAAGGVTVIQAWHSACQGVSRAQRTLLPFGIESPGRRQPAIGGRNARVVNRAMGREGVGPAQAV